MYYKRRSYIKNVKLFTPLLALTLSSAPLATQASNLGLSVKASTLGAGLELDYAISEHFSVRLQANQFNYDDDFEEDDIDYTGEIDFSSLGLLVDWHSFGGSFHITAGMYSNSNELSGVGTGDGDYDIGDRTYRSSSSDPVNLDLTVELGDSTAPYLGIGWGNSPANKGGFMFSFDLGVLMSGSPKVNLEASGTATDLNTFASVNLATDPTVQQEVNKEIQNLEDDISDFEIYPVIMFGIGYRF